MPEVPLYVFTGRLNTATCFPLTNIINVEIFGGEVLPDVRRVVGAAAIEAPEKMRFNIALSGTSGFHPDYGFTNLLSMISSIFFKVIERSDKVAMLMDFSEVNYCYTQRMIPLETVDILVTYDKLEPHIKKHFESKNITVL